MKARFCIAGRLPHGHGMDPRVCATSLRSLLRPRMTKEGRLHRRARPPGTMGRERLVGQRVKLGGRVGLEPEVAKWSGGLQGIPLSVTTAICDRWHFLRL